MGLQRVVKPKTQKGKRFLEDREPKIIENIKQAMVLRGGKTSEIVNTALKDLHSLKKPNVVMTSKRNEFRPFEDQGPIEQMAKKLDCSLFLFGFHSKKRPHSVAIGRLFDHQVLDMFEIGLENYQGLMSFKNAKTAMGSKPCLIFNGTDWDSTLEYQRLKNLLIDFFRGPEVEKVQLMGMEQALTFTLCEGVIYARNYRIQLMKSGSRTPRAELEEIGPSFNFAVRRHKLASESMYKDALKVHRTIKPKKKKNVSHDSFGSKLGRIHMKKQDISKLQLRKVKALRKGNSKKKATSDADSGAADASINEQP